MTDVRAILTSEDLDDLPVGSIVGVLHHGLCDPWLKFQPDSSYTYWKGLEIDPDDKDVYVEGSQRYLYNVLEEGRTVILLWSPS